MNPSIPRQLQRDLQIGMNGSTGDHQKGIAQFFSFENGAIFGFDIVDHAADAFRLCGMKDGPLKSMCDESVKRPLPEKSQISCESWNFIHGHANRVFSRKENKNAA